MHAHYEVNVLRVDSCAAQLRFKDLPIDRVEGLGAVNTNHNSPITLALWATAGALFQGHSSGSKTIPNCHTVGRYSGDGVLNASTTEISKLRPRSQRLPKSGLELGGERLGDRLPPAIRQGYGALLRWGGTRLPLLRQPSQPGIGPKRGENSRWRPGPQVEPMEVRSAPSFQSRMGAR